MIQTRRVLPIFLASPGDLSAERQYAKECVDEWNLVNEERTGWTVELMGWEDTLPQTGRPQEVINTDVKRCVLFIGMMWKKWGSATGNGYTSGFHEEFELATNLFKQQGTPEIALFFKEIPSIEDPGEELRQVLSFKKAVIDGKFLLFKELSNEAEIWKDKFRQNVHKLIFNYVSKEESATTVPSGTQSDNNASTVEHIFNESEVSDNLSLMRTLSSRLGIFGEDDDVPRSSIAQMRLAALSWKRNGLSETYLGTHDANIIYKSAAELNLSNIEKYGLIDSGLSTIDSKNSPLWKWVSESEGGRLYLILTAIFADEDGLSIAAFTALKKIKEPIEGAWKDRFIEKFPAFKPDVKKSAIRYMARLGGAEYIDLLKAEISQADVSILEEAISAVALILCRESYAKALTFLIDETVSLPRSLRFLMEKIDTVEVATLRRGTRHRDSNIRASSLKALRELGQVETEEAALLRGDPAATVRKEAVLCALASGEKLTFEDIKKILVRSNPRSSNALTIGSEGDREFEELERILMREESDSTVHDRMLSNYSPAEYAYELLAIRQWKHMANQVRADVSDDFNGFFERVRDAYRKKFGDDPAERMLSGFTPSLKGFRTKFMRRAALNVISTKGEAKDLPLVRQLLQSDISLEELDLKYLSRHGEWCDITVIDIANSQFRGIMLNHNPSITDLAAKTACTLAKGRSSEFIKLDISKNLLSKSIRQMTSREFSSLKMPDIILLLSDKDDSLREEVSRKCVSTMSRKRVKQLLSEYLNLDNMFYNVIYVLDAGIALSKSESELVLQPEA